MPVARIKNEPTKLLQIFFGNAAEGHRHESCLSSKRKALVLLLQGYIEHDVYFGNVM